MELYGGKLEHTSKIHNLASVSPRGRSWLAALVRDAPGQPESRNGHLRALSWSEARAAVHLYTSSTAVTPGTDLMAPATSGVVR